MQGSATVAHQADVMKAQSISEVSPGLQKTGSKGLGKAQAAFKTNSNSNSKPLFTFTLFHNGGGVCGGLGCEHPSHLFDHRFCRHRDLDAFHPASREFALARRDRCVSMIQTCARKTMGGGSRQSVTF